MFRENSHRWEYFEGSHWLATKPWPTPAPSLSIHKPVTLWRSNPSLVCSHDWALLDCPEHPSILTTLPGCDTCRTRHMSIWRMALFFVSAHSWLPPPPWHSYMLTHPSVKWPSVSIHTLPCFNSPNSISLSSGTLQIKTILTHQLRDLHEYN